MHNSSIMATVTDNNARFTCYGIIIVNHIILLEIQEQSKSVIPPEGSFFLHWRHVFISNLSIKLLLMNVFCMKVFKSTIKWYKLIFRTLLVFTCNYGLMLSLWIYVVKYRKFGVEHWQMKYEWEKFAYATRKEHIKLRKIHVIFT